MQSGALDEAVSGPGRARLSQGSTGSFCSPPMSQKESRLFLCLPLEPASLLYIFMNLYAIPFFISFYLPINQARMTIVLVSPSLCNEFPQDFRSLLKKQAGFISPSIQG